jgi:hypothetical protein
MTLALLVLFPMSAAAQSDAEPWSLPRTAAGVPDLNGVWDFRTITPMERPDSLAGKAVLTDEEAASLEEQTARERVDKAPPPGQTGTYNRFWVDYGTSVVDSRRTSLIVDPPNGRIPALTGAAAEKRAAERMKRRGVDGHAPTPGGWVEDLGSNGLQLRCIRGLNAGPPMAPGPYNNFVQLFQTDDHVALLNEMNHDVRVITLDGSAHVANGIRQWMGDSRGHWDGDTLVVETRGFLRETSFRSGLTDANLSLVERFTLSGPDTLRYEVTVADPTVWTEPWTYEIPMARGASAIYEYACHEGNYAMMNILTGARATEQAAENAATRD